MQSTNQLPIIFDNEYINTSLQALFNDNPNLFTSEGLDQLEDNFCDILSLRTRFLMDRAKATVPLLAPDWQYLELIEPKLTEQEAIKLDKSDAQENLSETLEEERKFLAGLKYPSLLKTHVVAGMLGLSSEEFVEPYTELCKEEIYRRFGVMSFDQLEGFSDISADDLQLPFRYKIELLEDFNSTVFEIHKRLNIPYYYQKSITVSGFTFDYLIVSNKLVPGVEQISSEEKKFICNRGLDLIEQLSRATNDFQDCQLMKIVYNDEYFFDKLKKLSIKEFHRRTKKLDGAILSTSQEEFELQENSICLELQKWDRRFLETEFKCVIVFNS